MAISKKEVKKVAQLARLQLAPEEEQKYTKQLSSILDYVDQLQEVAIDKQEFTVEEIKHKEEELRKDEQDGGRYQGEILEQAPTKKNSFITVPSVFEE